MTIKKEGMPWFRMYASVILADTNFRTLNEIQVGWYFKLMLETWFRAGFLPDDDDTLRTLAGCRRRDSWNRLKAGVLFFFDRQEHEGQNVLVHAGLRKQWLSANEAYSKKVERKQLNAQSKLTAPKALPPAKDHSLLTIEEFARLVRRPVELIQKAIDQGSIPKIRTERGLCVQRESARLFQ